ncbi:hypothetical protein O0I10_010195 [Lichtheimia ornata]|uniref:Uncharacterized protein n=1 Tax=Lichtheimia ornata TaxID=688661 RepID=A0AAD7UX23_9FUNG|nr:uncharacterized protein O0I10_010195 [Lichtheimia ornata]KAJ8654120.1 hypothetical protein O0I10_010195 [Lichtheimia ornata]
MTKSYDIPLGPEFFDAVSKADGEEILVLNAAKLISRANELWGNEGWSSETTIEQMKYATKRSKEEALVEALSRFGEGLGLCGQDQEYMEQIKDMDVPTRFPFDPDHIAHHPQYDPSTTKKRPAVEIPAPPEPKIKKTNTQQGSRGSGGRGKGGRGRGGKGGNQSSTTTPSPSAPTDPTTTPSPLAPTDPTTTPSSSSTEMSTTPSSSSTGMSTTPSSSSTEMSTTPSSSSSIAFKKQAYTQMKLPFDKGKK